MKENILLVEKFVEKKGGVDGFSEDLFEEFRNFQPNRTSYFTKRMFEVALLRVCASRHGVICYACNTDRYLNRKRYVINLSQSVGGLVGSVQIEKVVKQ